MILKSRQFLFLCKTVWEAVAIPFARGNKSKTGENVLLGFFASSSKGMEGEAETDVFLVFCIFACEGCTLFYVRRSQLTGGRPF